jgi:hypothetical protein
MLVRVVTLIRLKLIKAKPRVESCSNSVVARARINN